MKKGLIVLAMGILSQVGFANSNRFNGHYVLEKKIQAHHAVWNWECASHGNCQTTTKSQFEDTCPNELTISGKSESITIQGIGEIKDFNEKSDSCGKYRDPKLQCFLFWLVGPHAEWEYKSEETQVTNWTHTRNDSHVEHFIALKKDGSNLIFSEDKVGASFDKKRWVNDLYSQLDCSYKLAN